MNRTPGPWKVDYEEGRILACDPRETIIALMAGPITNPDIAADADFIVKACNVHNDLVEALNRIADVSVTHSILTEAHRAALRDIAREALAKVQQ